MNSKTKWSLQFGTVSLALALSAVPVTAQTLRNPSRHLQFSFAERADPAKDLYLTGQNLFDNAKWSQAETVFRQVLQKFPRNPIAARSSYYLIRSLQNQRKVSDALAQIEVFRKQYPKSEWRSDVEELRVKLTNTVPEEYMQSLATPVAAQAPRPPAGPPATTPTPAPPAAVAIRQGQGPFVLVPGRGQQRTEVSPEVALQQEVLRVLFETSPDRAIEIATDRLKADPTDLVALGNLHMVANSRSEKALPMLITLAKTSPDSRTRRDAVNWISRSRGEKDAIADILISLVPSMIADEDSSGITYALSQVNTPKSIDALATIARDKNKSDRVRQDAFNWIAESRVTNKLTLLEDIYKSYMENPKTRRQILPFIGRSKDPQAVNILANIAANDPDQNVKRDAVNFLGQIKTPEALKALEGLLTKKP